MNSARTHHIQLRHLRLPSWVCGVTRNIIRLRFSKIRLNSNTLIIGNPLLILYKSLHDFAKLQSSKSREAKDKHHQ